MPLSAGTRLGPYEIISPLGAGGMGEVYRARDSKLNRDVALKVLPEEFALDADRLAYQSNESGPVEVYVRPFPGPGGKSQVSMAGGNQPRWRPDGKELFYVAPDGRLMAVSIAAGADKQTLETSPPVPLFAQRGSPAAQVLLAW